MFWKCPKNDRPTDRPLARPPAHPPTVCASTKIGKSNWRYCCMNRRWPATERKPAEDRRRKVTIRDRRSATAAPVAAILMYYWKMETGRKKSQPENRQCTWPELSFIWWATGGVVRATAPPEKTMSVHIRAAQKDYTPKCCSVVVVSSFGERVTRLAVIFFRHIGTKR